MQTSPLRTILRAIVIGLLGLFIVAITGMVLYPFQGDWQRVSYHLKAVFNGDLVYYNTFRWYSTVIEPLAPELAMLTAEEILPLEQSMVGEHPYSDAAEKNRTVISIPSAQIKGGLKSGQSPETMNRGLWHYPGSGLPGSQQKIIVIGHRYLNVPPAQDTFYNLDKVHVGAKVQITSDLGSWQYTVTATRVVDRHDTSILHNTGKEQLLLITCHPLWTSQQRLVIIAKPDLANQYI